MQKQQEEVYRLRELEQKLRPASLRGVKECVMCGLCCHRRSCIPTPDELVKIAEFLKITPIELINKHFVVDRMNSSDIYFVKPAGIHITDITGKFLPMDRTWNEGPCVFLNKDNKCDIHAVKPTTAKETNCWKESTYDYNQVYASWKDNALKTMFGIDGQKLEDESDVEEDE